MSTLKILTLAGFTALSFAASAMAQSEGPSMPTLDDRSRVEHVSIVKSNAVQAGSSDTDLNVSHALRFDYGTLANPG